MAEGRSLAARALYAVLGSRAAVAARLATIRRSGKLTILNLHRVGAEDGSAYRPLDPALFEYLLDFLAARFDLVSLADLDGRSTKPKAVLSFDDGYKDFIEIAVPIMRRRGVRANLNVIPGCIARQLPPFNVLAQDFVGKAPRELVERLDVPGFGPLAGPGLGDRLSRFLKNRPRAEQRQFEEQLLPQFFAWDGFQPTPMMTLDEVRQVAADHDIGGHSWDHATMGLESDDYFREDLSRCTAFFREHLAQPMTIYAFPNGSCTPSQLDIARQHGVEHVLLVGEDFSAGRQVHHRFTFGAESRAEVRFRATGARRLAA